MSIAIDGPILVRLLADDLGNTPDSSSIVISETPLLLAGHTLMAAGWNWISSWPSRRRRTSSSMVSSPANATNEAPVCSRELGAWSSDGAGDSDRV